MLPIRPADQNFVYKAPPGAEDEVGDLPVRRVLEEGKPTEIHSAWKPSDEELAFLNNGGVIEVGVWGMMPPPPISVNVAGPTCEECGKEADFDTVAQAFMCAHTEQDRQPGLGEVADRPDPYPG